MNKRLTYWEAEVLPNACSRLLEHWRSQGVHPILLERLQELIDKLLEAHTVTIGLDKED